MSNFIARNLQLTQKTISLLSKFKPSHMSQAKFSIYTTSHCCNQTVNKLEKITKFKRSLHTEGDRRFVELLDSEISVEKENQDDNLMQMSDGWKVSFDGAEGKLVNNFNGDRVTVYFNLNGSIPPSLTEEEEAEVDEEGLIAYPDFTVQVEKDKSSNVMELECYFPDSSADDANESLFSIRTITVHSGDIKESTYMVETENIDPQVYSYFLTFLADRGVDNQFADELTKLCSQEENKAYIKSLEKLKSFIGSK